MTTYDYRALCAELLMALENAISIIYCEDGTKHISTAKPIVNRARAALADEPVMPEGKKPTRDELWELWLRLNNELPDRPAAVAAFWAHAQINARARAALAKADEPAVPQGREPASVTGQPSDEEFLKLAQQYSVVYLLSDVSACHPFQEGYNMRNDVLNFARAVLARWGTSNLTQTWRSPADGEMAELILRVQRLEGALPVPEVGE